MSVQALVPIIDHDKEEEEDHHHKLAADRGQSIVVDDTGGRTGHFRFVAEQPDRLATSAIRPRRGDPS
jgi:hypothetical protein